MHDSVTFYAEFGAWYPRFNMWTVRKPWDRYLADIWVLFEERLRHTDAKVLWRSYGPTHFGERSTGTFLALSGVLGDLPTRETCEPVDYGGGPTLLFTAYCLLFVTLHAKLKVISGVLETCQIMRPASVWIMELEFFAMSYHGSQIYLMLLCGDRNLIR